MNFTFKLPRDADLGEKLLTYRWPIRWLNLPSTLKDEKKEANSRKRVAFKETVCMRNRVANEEAKRKYEKITSSQLPNCRVFDTYQIIIQSQYIAAVSMTWNELKFIVHTSSPTMNQFFFCFSRTTKKHVFPPPFASKAKRRRKKNRRKMLCCVFILISFVACECITLGGVSVMCINFHPVACSAPKYVLLLHNA